MNGDAGECPKLPPAAGSAKRSLQTSIDRTHDRLDPGRVRENEDGPNQLDSSSLCPFLAAHVESSRCRAKHINRRARFVRLIQSTGGKLNDWNRCI
eukprot:4106435-Pleurochrysis_carterae.AAC.1